MHKLKFRFLKGNVKKKNYKLYYRLSLIYEKIILFFVLFSRSPTKQYLNKIPSATIFLHDHLLMSWHCLFLLLFLKLKIKR